MSKTIRTSNNLTIDAVGDIILDADNADVKLQDGGTEFGRISRVTSDLVIKSMGDNNDILFKGLDDSATITALQLDMSEGGNAIFSGNVTATDITANSLTTNVINSNGSNAGISIQPSGTGDVLLGALRVNGTTVSSDDSTKITVAEDVDVIGKLRLPDGSVSDNYAAFGDAEDLKIFHNGTHSIIREVGTGDLHVQSDNNVVLSKDAATEIMLKAIGDGAVELYHDNVKKLETTASGVIVGGDITAGSVTTNAISSNGSNADISIQPSGTGDVLLSALRVNGTTLDSSDSTKITLAEAVDITGETTLVGGNLVTNGNRITHAASGTVSFLDFTKSLFSETNHTVLSSVKSIDFFLDANGGDSGQAFRIFNNTNPDGSVTEGNHIFKVDESGDTTVKGDLTATDITANSLTTNVITSNGSNADININASGTGDVVLSALRVNGTTLDSADSSKITVAEAVDVTGTLFSRGNVFGVQRLTGSGSTEVINLTDTVTLLITTGSSQQFSLADGVEGQVKIISMVTDGGTGVVTPANFVNGTNITFDDVEDTVTLLYQSTGWVALARQNATFG
jgi:hypothetical protein